MIKAILGNLGFIKNITYLEWEVAYSLMVPWLDSFHCHLHRLNLPYVAAIIADGAVGREFAHARNIDN